MSDTRRLLIVIRDDKATVRMIPAVRDKLSRDGDVDMLFNDRDGTFCGLVLKTDLAAARVRAGIGDLVGTKDRGFIFVIEVGDEWSAIGNSSGWRHLQH